MIKMQELIVFHPINIMMLFAVIGFSVAVVIIIMLGIAFKKLYILKKLIMRWLEDD